MLRRGSEGVGVPRGVARGVERGVARGVTSGVERGVGSGVRRGVPIGVLLQDMSGVMESNIGQLHSSRVTSLSCCSGPAQHSHSAQGQPTSVRQLLKLKILTVDEEGEGEAVLADRAGDGEIVTPLIFPVGPRYSQPHTAGPQVRSHPVCPHHRLQYPQHASGSSVLVDIHIYI